MSNKRIKWIDALKGFTILTVVIGHVADGYLSAGLYNQYSGIMSILYSVIYTFHMPLFFIISGYLFYKSYYDENNILKKKNLLNQMLNLTCIYFIFSILQWCFKMLFSSNVNVPYTINDLLMMPLKPMAPYWYLHVLIIFYCISNYILKFKFTYHAKILILFAISIISKAIKINISILSISDVLYYGLFFYLGICFVKEKEFFSNLIKPINAILGLIIWSGLFTYNIYIVPGTKAIMAFTICIFIIFIFFKSRLLQESKILNLFGKYCLEIYVLHCFFTAGNRVILPKIGITNFYINVIANILISISIPIIFSMILKRINIQELFFRPMNFIKKHHA